jgi:hypothetical protein
MTVLFFIPMMVIALYESTQWKKNWLDDFIDGRAARRRTTVPLARDPDVDGEDARSGLAISTVPFSELVKVFPNIHEVSPISIYNCLRGQILLQSSETCIIKEIHQVKAQLDALTKRLDGKNL